MPALPDHEPQHASRRCVRGARRVHGARGIRGLEALGTGPVLTASTTSGLADGGGATFGLCQWPRR